MLYDLPLLTSDTVQKTKIPKVDRIKQLEKPQKQMPSTKGVKDRDSWLCPARSRMTRIDA